MSYKKILFQLVIIILIGLGFIGGGYIIRFLAHDTVGEATITYYRCSSSQSGEGFGCLSSSNIVEKCSNNEVETGKCDKVIGDSYTQVEQQPFYTIGIIFQILGVITLLYSFVVGFFIIIKSVLRRA